MRISLSLKIIPYVNTASILVLESPTRMCMCRIVLINSFKITMLCGVQTDWEFELSIYETTF